MHCTRVCKILKEKSKAKPESVNVKMKKIQDKTTALQTAVKVPSKNIIKRELLQLKKRASKIFVIHYSA